MGAKPPINTKETAPLQGCQMSKIDRLGLGAEVRELKLSNFSDSKIAEILNKSHEFTGANLLNAMGVWRWCKSNVNVNDRPLDACQAINVYYQECNMLESVNDALECVEYEIGNYRTCINNGSSVIGNIKDLSFTLEKLMARKQALIGDIKVMQEKVYSYNSVTKIISTAMDMVKENDIGLYAKIRARISEDSILQEAFRKIKSKD